MVWLRSGQVISASKEAGLAQEIRETFFEHLLLYTISVAYGHWANTTSATAFGVHNPAGDASNCVPVVFPDACYMLPLPGAAMRTVVQFLSSVCLSLT